MEDITGKVFGRLTAVLPSPRRVQGGARFWLFRCFCGTEKEIRLDHVLRGATVSCGCARGEARRNTGLYYQSPKTKECLSCHEELPVKQFRVKHSGSAKWFNSECRACEGDRHARYRKSDWGRRKKREYRELNRTSIQFHVTARLSQWKRKALGSDLTTDYLTRLFHAQRGLCYYSGVPLTIGARKQAHPHSLSLDRLNPESGYVQGNVVWCSYLVNTMKQTMSEQDFYAFLEVILTRARSRKTDHPE